jgi:hypothetical protein
MCAVAVMATACSSDSAGPAARSSSTSSPTTTTDSTPASGTVDRPAVRASIARGAVFLSGDLGKVEIHSLAVVDYLARKYGLGRLRDARSLIERRHADGDHSDPLVRLISPGRHASRRALAAVVGTDRFIALALECDRSSYPESFAAELDAAAAAGGMELTHAAFAIGLAQDLGCPPPVDASVRDSIVARLHDALAAAPVVDDVSLEQAAMLAYLENVDRVPASFVESIVAAQRRDGGWRATTADESSWHATVLALWAMSAMVAPGAEVSLVVPR